MDEKVIARGNGGPEAGVEHPVGVGGEGDPLSPHGYGATRTVMGIVVAADGVLVDMRGLDDGRSFGVLSDDLAGDLS